MSTRPSIVASTAGPPKWPIGVSDFGELLREGHTFVDKSLLARDVVQDGAKVTLITRPRRFGKTLNLSMLQHFFADEVLGRPTRGLFDRLAVAQDPDVMQHQGQHPVIFFTFKDIKDSSFATAQAKLSAMLSSLYGQHRELADSPRLGAEQKERFQRILMQKADLAELGWSLKLLSEYLYLHHGKPALLLLDEYDTPIHAAYVHGYYDEMAGFMRGLLGGALKDNPYLYKSMVTGILRVSKESLFSGLNNIEVHTVFSPGYSAYFGFTEAEVADLLKVPAGGVPDLEDLGERIQSWYNGYRFGERVIYNPWSIINCLKQKGVMQAYWVNTSDNTLLKDLMAQSEPEFKQQMEQLVQGGSFEQMIDPSLVFGDLRRDSNALWSLLLFSGYLTATGARHDRRGRITCRLFIPNQEVLGLYERHFEEWFSDAMSTKGYADFLNCLLTGKLDEFEARLKDYLRESASLFDVGERHPEKFYHGLVLGLISGLRDTHTVYSNRESGYGRYDVAVLPKAGGKLGILLEFKRVDDPAQLETAAAQALEQIDRRWYQTELQQHDVAQVLKIGMAFAGKRVAMKSAMSQ
jgi:hypothetical protein